MYNKIESGKRLKELREATGKTQLEVAKEIGISSDTISKLEQGKRCPSIMVVDLLREYYKTTADYIISGDMEQTQNKDESLSIIEKDKEIILKRIMSDLKDLIK